MPPRLLASEYSWLISPAATIASDPLTAWDYSTPIVGALGASLGVFALFFLGEVPRVRNDILRQAPFLNEYFDREIAPEDNVSFDQFFCLFCHGCR